MSRPRTVAIVPAAGMGVRLGADVPKALVEVGGTPMLQRCVAGLFESGLVDYVVIAVPADHVELVGGIVSAWSDRIGVVVGGAERTDSVRSGLAAVGADFDFVLVHDAARPLTPPEITRHVVEALIAGASAVVPGLPIVDTVKTVDESGAVRDTLNRGELRAIQTPQGFEARLLQRAYQAAPDLATTDDAGLVEALGVSIVVIEGHPAAFKVTTPIDLLLAEALLAKS